MKYLLYLIVLITFPISISAAAKYPFPQNVKYPYGIMPTTVDASKVQKAFEDFMKLYEESGDLARIKHDTPANTVSEGIGYGMLILVYMDNATNNTQAKFDKLWAYYNKYLDTKGLMNWKVVGFDKVATDGKNSATDAELDVAAALMEAYKQWGDEKYLTDAKAFIAKIAKEEVNANGYLKPGDSWDTEKNLSYFSTAALKLFKNASDFDWNKVITNSYSLIKKVQNSTTGLIPNWCSEQGTASAATRGNYTYDATRTPWRIAWAYSWYGDSDAKDICTKIAAWVSSSTANDPKKIVDGYSLDGTTTSKYNNTTFVGPFGCAGMVDAAHQAWVDKCFEQLPAMTETAYYQISIKILTLLYLSGNFPDFWTMTTSVPQKHIAQTAVTKLSLGSNFSVNPEISFSTATSGNVEISLYSINGQHSATAANGFFSAGNHRVPLRSALANGTYIVKMRTISGEQTGRISIAR
jgi:endo-1,4-beta-D-glucanase Y